MIISANWFIISRKTIFIFNKNFRTYSTWKSNSKCYKGCLELPHNTFIHLYFGKQFEQLKAPSIRLSSKQLSRSIATLEYSTSIYNSLSRTRIHYK